MLFLHASPILVNVSIITFFVNVIIFFSSSVQSSLKLTVITVSSSDWVTGWVLKCVFLVCTVNFSFIIFCIGLYVQNWPKRGRLMNDVERNMIMHLLLIKVKVSLKWVKCWGSCISPGFATVCTDGKDWLWQMVCHETLWRVWNWSYRLRKQTSCCL